MSWRAIIEDDTRAVMNSGEDQAARAKYLASGQSDPLEELIAGVTADFREAIRSNPENTLPDDETLLPLSSIRHAAVIIRHGLLGRFGMAISDGRMKEWDAAQKYLDKVEKGERKIASDGAAPAVRPNIMPSPAVNQSPRRDGWRYQDGV